MKNLSDLDPLLRTVERPSRYIAGEFGLPEMTSRSAPRLRVAFGFPDVYEVGMSHLGFRLLHAALVARPDLRVERVFLPWPDLQQLLQRRGAPLGSLESGTPIADFDLLGLSLQYELALPSVLRLLDLAGIPRRTEERARSSRPWPFVLVGGSGALNPEPLAPFVDAFFVGEADAAIHEVVDCLAACRGRPRAERIERLCAVPGLYLPELVEMEHDPAGLGCVARAVPPARFPVHRRYVEDLDALPLPSARLVPFCGIVHDRVTIEIQRGCAQGCRFCQAGFVTRPTRQRSAARVVELARTELRCTGYEDLSLLSLSAGDHPALQSMLAALIEEHGPSRIGVSLPSMRTESLHPAVAEYITRGRKTGFTLAPEAATDRLRRVINKGNTEADLLESVRGVVKAGYAQLKLYFMIGLPTETDEDVSAIADLSHRVLCEAQRVTRHVQLTVSVSTFVPKPHTPFQWEAAPDLAQIRHKQGLLQARTPRRVRLKWHDPGQSLVEAYLSRADRRMASVLERIVTPDHYGLDAWTDHFSLAHWEQALQQAHAAGETPPPDLWLAPRDPRAGLPWDHLDVGVERRYLERERAAALRGETRPGCTDGHCDQCGVCPDESLHRLRPEPLSVTSTPAPTAPDAEGAVSSRGAGGRIGLRVWFQKRGRARLISHLEMIKVFERAARRAKLPLEFSSGFHPKPRMSFSPALPLGAESLCEFVEMRLSEPLDPESAGLRLEGELPPGLPLERCEPAEGRLLQRIAGIRWRVELPQPAAPVLEAAHRRLQNKEPLRAERQGRGAFDLGPEVMDLSLEGELSLAVTCRASSKGTPRPNELCRVLLGLDQTAAEATRVTRLSWIFAELASKTDTVPAPAEVESSTP